MQNALEARSPRAFGTPTDRHRRRLAREGAAFRSLTDALDTTTPRARLAFHIFGGGRGYARRSEPSGRHDRAARVACWGSRPTGPRRTVGRARAPYPASTRRQSYQVCGKSRGKSASSVSAGNRSESLPFGVSDPGQARAIVSLSTRRAVRSGKPVIRRGFTAFEFHPG